MSLKSPRRYALTSARSDTGHSFSEYDLAGRPTKTLAPSLVGAGQNYVTVEYDWNGNVTKHRGVHQGFTAGLEARTRHF